MLARKSRRRLNIYKLGLELEKLAQQYNLPGVVPEPIDNTQLQKEDEAKRYDLSGVDLGELVGQLHSGITNNDIRKIILHELKANPEFPKQTVINAVINDAKKDLRALIEEHLSHMPELRAKLPDDKQPTLPNTPPDIRILPTQKDIEETKVRLDKEKAEAIEEYDTKKAIVVEKYKAENNGKEPDEWTLRKLMDYKDDPRGGSSYGYRTAPTSENIKLDLNQITQGQYDSALKQLYRLYYSIEKSYAELDGLQEKMDVVEIPAELPPKDPASFKTYREMVYDLRDRTLVGLKSIVANSIGFTLFGAASGRGWRGSEETSIMNQQETEWFENPGSVKAFLEKVPTVYDNKDRFWQSYGYTANDIKFWFEQKQQRLKDYDDSLKRTKASFGKGIRFLKMMNTKLTANLDIALDTSAFQYSEYIEASAEHKAKLDALYLEIVKRIQDTSKVATRSASYYNNGMYKDSNTVRDMGDVDFSRMLSAKKTTQSDMLNSLTKLLLSSIKKVAIQINDNELRPLVKSMANDMANLFIEERIGLKMTDLPKETKPYYGSETSTQAIYGDPRTMKVVDAWLSFASNSKLSTNFQSVIKYPEFIFKDDKETAAFIIAGMKEKLGYRITELLITNMPNIANTLIVAVINSPSFVYRGPEETRKLVFANKDEMFSKFQQEIDKAAGSGEFSFGNIGKDSMGESVAMPRFDKTKALLKSSIEQMTANEKLIGGQDSLLREVSYMAPGSGSYKGGKNIDESNIDSVVNKIIASKLDSNSSRQGIFERVLSYDATDQLIRNLRDRKNADNDPITIDLLNAGFFISSEQSGIIQRTSFSDLDTTEKVDGLNKWKLQTDFSNLKMDVLVQHSNYLRQLFNTAMPEKEIIDRVKGIIKKQEELNKDFNAKLHTAIAKLKYKLEINKQIEDEQAVAILFSKRLATFGGVGPYTIDAKFKMLNTDERFAHLPLQQIAKITNEKTMMGLKDGNITPRMIRIEKNIDQSSWAYNQFAGGDGYGTSAGIATAVISKTLDMKDAQQVYKLLELCDEVLRDGNISREEIEYIFPVMITNKDAIPQQLETAKALGVFAHSEGAGLPKEVILGFAKNPNFKDWVKEVDAVENFFDAYIKIKREGGARKFYSTNRATFKALLETKALKPGAQRRMELIEQAFENNTRINPSIEGFDSIKKLIAQTNYDMAAVEQFATFSKYNTQIQEQKLFKDPALEKLNWNVADKKFRFRVLKTFDPQHFSVGVDTNCCQKLGGAGEAAAIDSYINPLAGVVVLEAMIEGSYTLISQSYFHYVPQTNGVILDNVEHTNMDDEVKEATGYDIDQLYAMWAKFKKDQNKYDYFLCGMSYNKLDNDKFGRKKLNKDPRSFKHNEEYTDWRANSSVDLLTPKFELPEEEKAKKKQKRKEALFEIGYLLASINSSPSNTMNSVGI